MPIELFSTIRTSHYQSTPALPLSLAVRRTTLGLEYSLSLAQRYCASTWFSGSALAPVVLDSTVQRVIGSILRLRPAQLLGLLSTFVLAILIYDCHETES